VPCSAASDAKARYLPSGYLAAHDLVPNQPTRWLQRLSPDPCAGPSPCRYGGVCRTVGSSFTCQCSFGYSGRFCEIIDACLIRRPCLNGGLCQPNPGGSYFCQCRNGYFGVNCELQDACRQWNPCRNGGQCVPTGGSGFFCRCLPQWQGPQRDLPVTRPGVVNEFG
jgi:hypothetical protein